jgi:DNA-directed RNA polymerase specialized sigma24 family protein
MFNQETRLHPEEFERCMTRLTPALRRQAEQYAGGDPKIVDDLLQESVFAVWQFDPSKVTTKRRLASILYKVARIAMARYAKRAKLAGTCD